MLLIDEILSSENIGMAMDSVVKNNDSAGVDDMDACELPMWRTEHGQETPWTPSSKTTTQPVSMTWMPVNCQCGGLNTDRRLKTRFG